MLDTNFHFAPHASASSGYMNLIYTPGKLGRVRGLKLLTAAETGAHMPLVQQQRLVAMAMEPLGEGALWGGGNPQRGVITLFGTQKKNFPTPRERVGRKIQQLS